MNVWIILFWFTTHKIIKFIIIYITKKRYLTILKSDGVNIEYIGNVAYFMTVTDYNVDWNATPFLKTRPFYRANW